MAECPGSQSVTSKTFDYSEICGKDAEFLRRACTYTPKKIRWAGDFIIMEETMTHQSLMKYFNGSGACAAEHTFPAASEDCGPVVGRPPGVKDVEADDIQDKDGTSFFTVAEGEPGWDIHIAASNDGGCGASMAPQDGGDILFNFEGQTKIKSLCGTVEISSYGAPQAFYLDNRLSYSDDPDRGLFVAIQNGLTGNWKVIYADTLTQLNSGLINAEDISAAFLDALTEKGISKQDVFSLGMI